jgi:hypothetical protein
MNRMIAAVTVFVGLGQLGCDAQPVADAEPEAAAGGKADNLSNRADRACRVFLMNGGIPSHTAIDGDFNQVSAITGRQDASGKFWWPFAVDVGLGRLVSPTGVAVGLIFFRDGQSPVQVEATTPTTSSSGVPIYHLEWGEGLFPFANGSLLECPPGSLRDCLVSQPELKPLHIEAYVRMPDGTTYWDHNTANFDQTLAGDLSNLRLDGSNAWQTPQRDLLHCFIPGT